MKILLIEDEVRLSEAIAHILKENKYSVDTIYNGEDGYHYIMTNVYDVVLLDVNLPIMNGFEVLKRVRDEGNKSIILMLTARSEIDDKVLGLDLGADDYLPKPFATKELLARIKALSRRNTNYEGDQKHFGDLIFDVNNYKLIKKKKSVTLTHLEGQLLELLMSRKHMITPKENIIVKLWGYDSEADDNNVEVYIFFLRKKLKYLESKVTIKTTRNVGYSLEVNGNV
ncbi:response regulator transcription factor [Candidatus Izemoplasma sp. B36]|uniref:response regulator transcription factor n=1 Tax=Candidatus Izemoplasma sp. B36 TaxID=3242468 RepID=UPI0035564E59